MIENMDRRARTMLKDGTTAKLQWWIIRGALSLVATFVFTRSAVSVLVLTLRSIGEQGLLVVASCSLIYFGVVITVARLSSNESDGAIAYWGRVLPSLSLGLSALVARLFFEQAMMEPKAYPLRIVLVATAILSFYSLLGFLFKPPRLKNEDEPFHRKAGEIEYDPQGSGPSVTGACKSGHVRGRFPLIASYFLNSTIWTALAVRCQYFSHSFLEHSPWVMAALWLFVASCWANCVAVTRQERCCVRLSAQ